MIATYRYTINGTAARDQTWTTTGEVTSEFAEVLHDAVADSFRQLTNGKAVFGLPGVGCNGPYNVDKILIERVS